MIGNYRHLFLLLDQKFMIVFCASGLWNLCRNTQIMHAGAASEALFAEELRNDVSFVLAFGMNVQPRKAFSYCNINIKVQVVAIQYTEAC